jgi:hypothetical protein
MSAELGRNRVRMLGPVWEGAETPRSDCGEISQSHDDRDVVHATQDELSVIGIHAL